MREVKPTSNPLRSAAAKGKAAVGVVPIGDVAVVTVLGLVDENFVGFGSMGS